MRDLYKRFNIKIDLNSTRKQFRNKINNMLFHGLAFNSNSFKLDDLSWDFCNKLGIQYDETYPFEDLCLPDSLGFDDYLLRLQALLDILRENNYLDGIDTLVSVINDAIAEAPFNLGIRLKMDKKKGAQIYLAGSKLLDEKLVDDILGVLEDKDKGAIRTAFEKGIKEYFEAHKEPLKLKNVFRDMQLSCDELMKYVFEDKNIGLKHLFKEDRWKKIGLNEYQKQIFWIYNEQIDKLVKHKADSVLDIAEAENIIYLTGLLIRFVFLKMGIHKS